MDEMRKFIYIVLSFMALLSCANDEALLLPEESSEGIIRFSAPSFEQITINTRSTLPQAAESRVRNMFLVMFDDSGQKVFSHFFNDVNLRDDLQYLYGNCWTFTDDQMSSGRLKITPANCTDGEIWLIANIDADMLNISPEKLNFVQSKTELQDFVASMNQEVITRTGMFPMIGHASDVDVAGKSITSEGSASFTIELERIDAKVSVNISVDKTLRDMDLDPGEEGTKKQQIQEFRPESWSVMNLPKGSFIVDRGASDFSDTGAGYFDVLDKHFESTDHYSDGSVSHGFSFYMLENKLKTGKSVSDNFHLRDKRIKETDGTYAKEDGDMWEYAPEHSTYLVIKGEVVMNVDVTDNAKTQKLSAQVVYYLHLGNFAEDKDNYSILRNSHYTYNVKIKGVDKIEVEVELDQGAWYDDNEQESGATGMVYVAREDIYTFDAHFGQRVFCFDADFIVPERVTWYVNTPFGREGTPEILPDGTEVPYGLDYKWVHFMVNDIVEGDVYNHKNQPYDPDNVMDVLEFVKYLKEQKNALTAGTENDFRLEYDDKWREKYNADYGTSITEDAARADKSGIWYRNVIYVTTFVDEFYYDEHPINPIEGQKDPLLWQEFVNQPNRLMHILSDSKFSLDGESAATGSVVTIRQHSIQTPFNYTDPSISSAWGMETIDESTDYFMYFYNDEKQTVKADKINTPLEYRDKGNTSITNGRYNTMRIWKLYTSEDEYDSNHKWDDYLDYDRNNDHNLIFLKNKRELATLRYACMMRNRDENGNGLIDASEVKWYTASLGQLNELFVGEQGVSEGSRLYTKEDILRPNFVSQEGVTSWGWLKHIISSTVYTGEDDGGSVNNPDLPAVLWANEGPTNCYYKGWGWNDHQRYFSVRCIRNLGMDDETEDEARRNIMKVSHESQPLVIVNGPGVNGNTETVTRESVYTFDFSRVNHKSIRAWSSVELEPTDQFEEQSKVSLGFVTGAEVTAPGTGRGNQRYDTVKKMIESGQSPCPSGYRMPNIRELAMMSVYLPLSWFGGYNYMSSSYYGLGKYAEDLYGKEKNKYTWYVKGIDVTLGENNVNLKIRCVKDSDPATW